MLQNPDDHDVVKRGISPAKQKKLLSSHFTEPTSTAQVARQDFIRQTFHSHLILLDEAQG
jgi:hypothetical protein